MALPGAFPDPSIGNAKLTVYQAAERYRQQLLAREQGTVDDLTRRWRATRDEIERELATTVQRIENALASGKRPVVLPLGGEFGPDEFSASWLYQAARMDEQANALNQQLAIYAQGTQATVRRRVLVETGEGQKDAQGLMRFAVREDGLVTPRQFAQLPQGALEQITAFSGPLGPLPKAFRDMGPELVRDIQQRLINGVAQGLNPRVVARQMQADAEDGGILDRPLFEQVRVARTEPLRAYRESGRQTYLANSDVVLAWEWNAFPGRRTCAFCLAMDGTRHSLDEIMATHPQCRCQQIPVTELSGDPEFRGAEFLYNLSAKEQDAVFGSKTLGQLYRNGQVQLADMPEFYNHQDWGRVGRVASMESLKARGIISSQDIVDAKGTKTARPIWDYVAPVNTRQLPLPVPPVPAQLPIVPPAPAVPPLPTRPEWQTKAQAIREQLPIDAQRELVVKRNTGVIDTQELITNMQLPSIQELEAIGAEALQAVEGRLGRSLIEHYEALEADLKEGALGDFVAWKLENNRTGYFVDKTGKVKRSHMDDWRQAREDVRRKYQREVVQAVADTLDDAGRPAATIADMVAKIEGKPTREAMGDITGLFPKDWLASRRIERKFTAKKTTARAHWDPGNLILRTDLSASTSAHELLHSVESTYFRMTLAERQYFEFRTSSERAVTLKSLFPNHGYRSNEITKRDQWGHPYMGKDYGGNAFELGSMFMGALMGEDGLALPGQPITGILNDRAFMNYMMGVLFGI